MNSLTTVRHSIVIRQKWPKLDLTRNWICSTLLHQWEESEYLTNNQSRISYHFVSWPGRQQACWTSLWWCKQWTCWQELPPVNVKPPGGVAWELVRARVLHLGEVERIRHIQRKFKLSPHIGLALCRSESFPLSAMNIQYEIFQHYVLAQRKKGRAQKLMKFRPLVRKLPRAPLDQLLPQETPGPPKTEDWGKVKVRRGFPHIKSEQESESEEKLSSHSMRLVILKLKKGKPAQRVLYFSAWSVVGSVSQCWFGQMLRVGTRPEHVF